MKRWYLIIALFILFIFPSSGKTETINLTTYYPAPYGSYDTLKLVPRSQPSGACQIGTFFSLEAGVSTEIKYCEDDGDGDGEGLWADLSGLWDKTDDDVYLSLSEFPNLRVGIGNEIPTALFDVTGIGGANDDLFRVGTTSSVSDAGNAITVKNTGVIGIGTTEPELMEDADGNTYEAKLSIRGAETGVGATAYSFLIEDSEGNPIFTVRDNNRVGIGVEPNRMDNQLDIGGSVEIQAIDNDLVTPGSEREAMLLFNDNAATANATFVLGVDTTDGTFRIESSENPGDENHFQMDESGNIIIGGSITVTSDDTNEGEVMVEYVPDATSAGYYATYAP